MTTPTPNPELDARVADLATGFAIGDLDEAELRELYDLLRDEQNNGNRAAQVAWETLGVVTDIRTQVSSTFQDTVAHRLQQASMSGRFTNALLKRLGMRSGGLQPVETPQPKAPLRIALWLVVAVVAGALLAGGIGWVWSVTRSVRATVTSLHGSATIAGQSLTPGAEVDHRSLVVKPGGQLTLLWSDGSSAAIAGGDDGSEAVATVRGDGLVLLRGQAWVTGRSGFVIQLPDRRCRVDQDDTSVAAQVVAQRGFVGVRRGVVHDDRLGSTLGENMGSGPNGGYRWQWEWDLMSGSLGRGTTPPPDWRLGADLVWRDLTDTVRMVFTGTDPAGHGLELRMIPGLLVVMNKGQEIQRLTLPGSPLLNMHLSLRQSEAKTLTVAVEELSLTVPLAAPIGGYRLHIDGRPMIKMDTFHPLPTPRPAIAMPGW
ncbi:MAG TPA: hypothetical protein VHX44_10140 [Planctomycetota bacterium]|nr:hypothetical protein [Planctomycetota bacterium]